MAPVTHAHSPCGPRSLPHEKRAPASHQTSLDRACARAMQVCDALEDVMEGGGVIVDYHSCDFFPERWFDLVVVLQCDNTVLWNRLEKRGYSQPKIQENVQCEVRA